MGNNAPNSLLISQHQELLAAATAGDASAQFNLAESYLYGDQVNVDEKEAAVWLHKAVMQGHIEAISELATSYRLGRGVPKQIAIAAEMYVIAALEGDMNALGNLADYHSEIAQEALSGSKLAALSLGKAFDRGLGVERDRIKMLAWLIYGMQRGVRDDDADVKEELASMSEFYSLVMASADKAAAKKLVNQMSATTPRLGGTKLKRRRKPSTQRKPSAKPIAGGG